jgi:hypothetical protein
MITIKNGLNFGKLDIAIKQGVDKALGAMGLQLMNNTVNGSMTVATRPPILEGVLRGSGSVFVGSKLIATSKKTVGRPATSYGGKANEATVIFNTAYAARWHENRFNPGPGSIRDGNVGWKYLEVHMKGDSQELMELGAAKIRESLK